MQGCLQARPCCLLCTGGFSPSGSQPTLLEARLQAGEAGSCRHCLPHQTKTSISEAALPDWSILSVLARCTASCQRQY